MRSNYKKLGRYIKQVKVKNKDGKVDELCGISIDKEFMPSVANVIGTDMTRYSVVSQNQFACNFMHVGRDERLPIALLLENKKVLVSPAYTVFEVTDKSKILPEYLMMWFRRPEFDRYAWFATDSSIRGSLSWEAFYEADIYVPDIEKQREIVKEYNMIINRIELNQKFNQKLEETAQALYKHWFVDRYNDSWRRTTFGNEIKLNYGKSLVASRRKKGDVIVYGSAGVLGFHDKALIDNEGIIVGRKGSIGSIFYSYNSFFCIDTAYYITQNDTSLPIEYVLYYIKSLDLSSMNEDSAVPGLNRNSVYEKELMVPPQKSVDDFANKCKCILSYKKNLQDENTALRRALSFILMRLSDRYGG